MPVDSPPVSKVYQDQLTTLSHGLALWNPSPLKEIYDKVSIGDVGYLHEGSFIRMFNVVLPWNHESNRTLGEPEPYQSLDCGPFANTFKRQFDKVKHCSCYVSAETYAGNSQFMTPDDVEGVTYKFRNCGALLSLPSGGHHEDVIRSQAFEDYIRDYVDSWFTWAQKNRLGVERVEDLILVSGCTLVTSWAAAAFVGDSMDAEISLASRTLNNGGASFAWSNIQGRVLYHNSRFEPFYGKQISTMTQDQCVFIRGFRVKDDKMQVIQVSCVPEHDGPNIGIVDTIGPPIKNESPQRSPYRHPTLQRNDGSCTASYTTVLGDGSLIGGSSSSLDTIRPPINHENPYPSSTSLPSNGSICDASFITSFSIETLPASNTIIDGAFLGDKSKPPPLLTVSRTPSLDKPLPIAPLSASPTSIDDDALDGPRLRDPLDSPPSSATIPSKVVANGTSKRTHALIGLIESERAYASDLALIRDIYLPAALGNEPPFPSPPRSSSSSLLTPSNASGSSTALLGPPMMRDDARIIFSNLSELAEFADDFQSRLETALGNVLPSGEGEDRVGAFFIEMIPRMKSPYIYYNTHHPASLTHLNSLPQTPALAAYHATTRVLVQQRSHAWDLPSLLIKPVRRLREYALLLNAIIEATPDSHGDKENLRRAKNMVEAVSRAVNERLRRREIVKEVFAAGKPTEFLKMKGLGIVRRIRGGVSTPRSISRADSEENERVVQLERSINLKTEFIQKFTKETVDWVKSVHVLMSSLRVWAEGFGRLIGLGPDVTSEAFDAFLVVVDKQLTALCIDLKALVEKQLLPQVRVLLETIKRPGLLLETLHALEPHHHALLQHNPTKGRLHPALNEASIAYIALRTQLVKELPPYLNLLHAGVTLCVGQVMKWQSRLWRDVRTRWSDLWNALRVEGEMNAGNEETERVWRARWEEATRDLYNLVIISDKLTPRSRQARTSPPSPTTTRNRLARRPSTDRLYSIRSARSSSGHGHYVDAPEYSPSPPRHAMRRRQSIPMSLHHSQSHGQLLDSYGREGQGRDTEREEEQGAHGGGGGGGKQSLLPSLQRRNLGAKRARPAEPLHRQPSSPAPHRQYTYPRPHPPMPPMPQLTVSSRWYQAPALYKCRVVHECEPPEGVEYYGLPFFKLFLDDVYDVLREAGHPKRHRDLPLLVDEGEGEDCLLFVRDPSGELGWLLASFMFPVD